MGYGWIKLFVDRIEYLGNYYKEIQKKTYPFFIAHNWVIIQDKRKLEKLL